MNQGQEALSVEYRKRELAFNWKISEESIKADIREEKEIRREQRREYRAECHKARYLETVISANGKINIIPQNKLVDIPERVVTSFKFVEIRELRSSDGEGGYYLLKILIGSKIMDIFLNGKKACKPEYLLRKLVAAGGNILIGKKSERDEFLRTFWTTLYERCERIEIYATQEGWIKLGAGKFRFVGKEEKKWEEILKLAS